MRLRSTLTVSFRALRRNVLRSLLTALGIIVGASAASGVAMPAFEATAVLRRLSDPREQATVIAFEQVFLLTGILFLGILPILMFLRRDAQADPNLKVHVEME